MISSVLQEPRNLCSRARPNFQVGLCLIRESVAIGYVKLFSRSRDTVIRVYDEAGNVIETHEQRGDFNGTVSFCLHQVAADDTAI